MSKATEVAGRLDSALSEGLGCNALPVTRERPILFSAPMVRALLDGSKTQTRRVVKGWQLEWLLPPISFSPEYVAHPENHACPYGQTGERLWVRETWARDDEDGALMYRADLGRDMGADAWEQGRLEGVPRYRWRPSIHMPRTASRMRLDVTGVRVERLQAISRGDAMAEGCPFANMAAGQDPRDWYADLWNAINGAGAWDANPWVWVVEFQRCPNLQPNVRANRAAHPSPSKP